MNQGQQHYHLRESFITTSVEIACFPIQFQLSPHFQVAMVNCVSDEAHVVNIERSKEDDICINQFAFQI